MKKVAASILCSLLLAWGAVPSPSFADFSSNPVLPIKAPDQARKKAQDAVKRFFYAQCKTIEAMKSYSKESNQLIGAAAKNFF